MCAGSIGREKQASSSRRAVCGADSRGWICENMSRTLPTCCLLLVALAASNGPLLAQERGQKCKAPPRFENRLATHPSAALYDDLGKYFGQNSNFACAVSAFRSSLKLDSSSAETRDHLAIALLGSGDTAAAARELHSALKLRPDLPGAHLNLGVALARLNQADAAIDEFYAAVQAGPGDVLALDWLAKSLIAEKRYPEVFALLKNASQNEALSLDLASAYSKAGNNDAASRILSHLLKDQPGSAAAHSGMAVLYGQQRRYQDAADEFGEALRLDPRDDSVRLAYAKTLLVLGQFQTVLSALHDFAQRHPSDFEAQYLAGAAYRELGNYKDADRLLRRALSINANHYGVRYNLGCVLARTGHPAQARVQLEKAVQLDPSSAEARFQLATVLRSLGLERDAKKQLERYQRDLRDRAQKDVAASKADQANEYLSQGETQKAVNLYRDAVAEDPSNAHMEYNLGMALDRLGDLGGERAALEKAISLDEGFAAAHNQLGFLILQAGHSPEAEAEFKAAIALDPHFAEAQSNLGTLYGQQGRDSEAEKMFRQSIKNDPTRVQPLINLGATLASESRFAEADAILQKALVLDPNNQEAHQLRGLLQDHLQ
jgi:Flp pilus assembly protein TadD